MLPFCSTLLPIHLSHALSHGQFLQYSAYIPGCLGEPCVNQWFLFYTVSWQEYSLWSLRHREPLDGSQG